MVAPGWIVTSIKDLTKRMEWLDSLGVHKTRMRVRDDLATMFCKRVSTKIKKAKTELEEIRLAEREITEALRKALTCLEEVCSSAMSAMWTSAPATVAAVTAARWGREREMFIGRAPGGRSTERE
ncbi:hypothetical protein ACWELB_38205 [Streptomyces asiaticus]